MPLSLTILSEVAALSDNRAQARQLRALSRELASAALSDFDLRALPLSPPQDARPVAERLDAKGAPNDLSWTRTNYITATYALTGWLVRSPRHPFGDELRAYTRARDSDVQAAGVAFPGLHRWHNRIRTWLAAGRVDEADLDKFCAELRYPSMYLFDPRAWMGPPAQSAKEAVLREASDSELAELLGAFSDYGPEAPWIAEAVAVQVISDKGRRPGLRVGEAAIAEAASGGAMAEDTACALLLDSHWARGGWETHKDARADRIARQWVKACEVRAFDAAWNHPAIRAYLEGHGQTGDDARPAAA